MSCGLLEHRRDVAATVLSQKSLVAREQRTELRMLLTRYERLGPQVGGTHASKAKLTHRLPNRDGQLRLIGERTEVRRPFGQRKQQAHHQRRAESLAWARQALQAIPASIELRPVEQAEVAILQSRVGNRAAAQQLISALAAIGYRHPAYMRDLRLRRS